MPGAIRLAQPEDAADLAAIYAPFCTSSIVSFEEVAPSPEEMADRLARITVCHPWLVLHDGGKVAGYAYASPHRERAAYRWAVDVTIYAHTDFRRRGVGTALYTSLFLLLSRMGYHQAFAGVALPNPGSERLHEAMGFTEVGVYRQVGFKLGAWRDVRWYQRPLAEPDHSPTLLLPLAAMLGTPAWEDALTEGMRHYRAG